MAGIVHPTNQTRHINIIAEIKKIGMEETIQHTVRDRAELPQYAAV